MDVAIIAALISAAASIVAIFTKHYLPLLSNTLTYRERKQKQLFQLFEPIEKIFFVNPNADREWLMKQVLDIVASNLSIVPIGFLGIIEKCRDEDPITKESIDALHNSASQYYNELKEILGYPYVSQPKTLRDRINLVVKLLAERYWVFWFALVGLVLCLIVFIASFFLNNANFFSDTEAIIVPFLSLILAVVLILFLLFADKAIDSTDA